MRRFAALLVVLLIGGALMPVRFVPSTDAPTHLGRFRDSALGEGKFSLGVPFANQAILSLYPNARMVVQAAFGADLNADPSSWPWVDITTKVRQNDGNIVDITPIGRSDEASDTQPAGTTFVLDNRSGDFTAYHPASQYYPYVRRNTPIRVLVNLTGDPLDTSTRFEGYANGWTPGWEVTNSQEIAVVAVSASGVSRRAGRGNRGKRTITGALRYYMTATSGAAGYWPLEADTRLANLVSPGGIATASGSEPEWGKFDGPPGAGKTAGFFVNDDRPPTTQVTAPVSNVTGDDWTVSVWIRALPGSADSAFFSVPVVDFIEVGVSGGSAGIGSWSIEALSNPPADQYEVTAVSLAPDRTLGTPLIIPQVLDINVHDGNWHMITLNVKQSGGSISATLTVDDSVSGGTNTAADTGTNGVLGAVYLPKQVDAAHIQELSLSNLAVFDGAGDSASEIDARYEAGYGYSGEDPVSRLNRLAAQVGIPIAVTGTSSTAMGPQSTGTLLELLRECEKADQGLLLDGLSAGFTYVARSARYNQDAALTVAAASAKLGVPFSPVDNDQRNVNVFTAMRKNGSQKTHEDSTGPLGTGAIGIYDSSDTFNIDADADIDDYASWAVHLGTVEGFRYPSLSLDFTATPELAGDWLAVLPLNLFDVTGLQGVFAQHPPGDVELLAEGWSERISPYIWKATVNTSRADPWTVGVLDTAGWLDCGGSTTSEALDTTETGVDLLITDVCTWTHADGDYNIVIGGEEMTVTAVGAVGGTSGALTQTLTVTRSVNGVVKSHASGAEVHVAEPIVLAL